MSPAPYYEHAGITIYHGDCSEIAASLPAASIALIVTSPPYNQTSSLLGKPSGMWAETAGGAGFHRAWKARGYADDIPESEYVAWQNTLFGGLASVCASDASMFYNHPEPDYEVAGVVRFWGGLGAALLLVREVDAHADDAPAGDESGGAP